MYVFNTSDISQGIKSIQREREYAINYKPSRVKTYFLTKEEIRAKYGKAKLNSKVPMIIDHGNWRRSFNHTKYKELITEKLEKIIELAIENYFAGMDAKDAIEKAKEVVINESTARN